MAKDRFVWAETIFISIVGRRNYGTLSKVPSNSMNGSMLVHFFVLPEEREPLVKMDLACINNFAIKLINKVAFCI